MTKEPLTEHQKAILRCIQEIAIAHGVTLSEDQYRAALELIGHVDIRDMKAAIPALKFRSGFPFRSEWILQAIDVQREQRRKREIERDKPKAASAYQSIHKELSEEDREAITKLCDGYWATQGGRPAPKPQRRLLKTQERHSPSLAGVPPFPAIAEDT